MAQAAPAQYDGLPVGHPVQELKDAGSQHQYRFEGHPPGLRTVALLQAGAAKMEAEQAAMGLDKPPVQYVDAAYVSAQNVLQARRQEQQTPAFQQRMKHRNAIEGPQSELVRAHGLRRARYRGLAKAKLQNYFIGAACNIKRWIRREAWKLRQAMGADAGPMASATAQ